LNQKVSSSVNSGSILTIATDNDFTNANTSTGRSSLNSGQFLVIAHNGTATTAQTNDLDASIYVDRISREWRVENTASV
jgi:hypothetical protein